MSTIGVISGHLTTNFLINKKIYISRYPITSYEIIFTKINNYAFQA